MLIRSNSLVAATVLALTVLLSCGDKKEVAPPLTPGISQNLTRSDLAPTPSTYVLDYIGSQVDPAAQKSIQVSGDADIAVSGWAIDGATKTTAGGVDVVIDQKPYSAQYGSERGDVATHFNHPEYRNSGFRLRVAPGQLSKGPHSVSIRVISSDKKSYYQGPLIQFSVN